MANQRTIEFVDPLNRVGGLASVARLIGNNYLKRLGADGYWTRSSGSHVDLIRNGEIPLDFMIDVVDKARKQEGIFKEYELRFVDKAIKESNRNVLNLYYKRAEAIFQAKEFQAKGPSYVRDVFRIFDIKGKLKETQDQTVASLDTLGVFAMSEIDNQKIQEIYSRSDYCPKVIEVLGGYSTRRGPKVKIIDPFGLGGERHIKSVEQLLKYVHQALDGLLGE